MTQPARCPECRQWIREERVETASKNRFQNILSGPKSKAAIVAWAMCEEWWTEARNADERSGMQARGTKQRELVEETPWEFPWIESGSLVRDFWSVVEYGGILEFLGRLKVRGEVSLSRTVSLSTTRPRMILSFRCLLIETVLIIIRVSSVTSH